MKYLPSKSAIQHSRFLFSFFLLPVYIFALSQVPVIHRFEAFLSFICWHLFIYPASNGYNSYFDKDEDSIALLEKPPPVDKSLYVFSLLLDLVGAALAFWVSIEFVFAVLIYGFLSKLYSHPFTRLKRYPIISFLVVFIFQGAFVYWTTYWAISQEHWDDVWSYNFFIAGLTCSCLIGASYPLTQVYQHDEDKKRGDKTLSILLGINGSFVFAVLLFLIAILLMFIYWSNLSRIQNFWIFLAFLVPVILAFVNWILKLRKDVSEVNFRSVNKMTLISGISMLGYFLFLLVSNNH